MTKISYIVFWAPFLLCRCYSESEINIVDAENTTVQCQDSIDNDNDGLTDCQDQECQDFDFCVDGNSDSDTGDDFETDSWILPDTDTQGDIETDDNLPGEGEDCTAMVASAIPLAGTCKKEAAVCEGGFASDLPPEMGPTQDCLVGLDCCLPADTCVGLKPVLEQALGVSPSCRPETGDGVCEQDEGLYNFQIGCPAETPTCCLVPLD